MSYPGWECVRHIAAGEVKVEWWENYAGRLTVDERQTIRGGDFRAFWRDLPPAFSAGDWLEVGPKLRVELGAVTLRRDRYRCTIARVRDFRTNGPFRMPNHRTDDGEYEPEPEGVDTDWLDRYAEEAAVKEGNWIREAIRG